jgi:hypothetical protein
MSGRTKPSTRRKWTQRADGITTTRMHNTRLTPAELDRIMQPCQLALHAMRTAAASFAQWVVLCTAGHVAEAIEDGGIYTGQRQIIEDANTALDAIGERCGRTPGQWHPSACYAAELIALSDLIAAHARQVHELTYREYTNAADKAVARVATVGGLVFKAEMGMT